MCSHLESNPSDNRYVARERWNGSEIGVNNRCVVFQKVLRKFWIAWTERRSTTRIRDCLRWGPLKTLLMAPNEKHEIHDHFLCLFLVAGFCDILWTWNQQHYDVQSGQEDVGQAVRSAGCRPFILTCSCWCDTWKLNVCNILEIRFSVNYKSCCKTPSIELQGSWKNSR